MKQENTLIPRDLASVITELKESQRKLNECFRNRKGEFADMEEDYEYMSVQKQIFGAAYAVGNMIGRDIVDKAMSEF